MGSLLGVVFFRSYLVVNVTGWAHLGKALSYILSFLVF